MSDDIPAVRMHMTRYCCRCKCTQEFDVRGQLSTCSGCGTSSTSSTGSAPRDIIGSPWGKFRTGFDDDGEVL